MRWIILVGLVVLLIGCTQTQEGNNTKNSSNDIGNEVDNMGDVVVLETSMGNIEIELADNMPVTTGNFKKLVEAGIYDGVIFHRVIPNFMIQGGDPTGTGRGDPSIPSIPDEFVEGSTNVRGTISMANRGPNTGSSQFFINLVDNTYLDWDKDPATSKHPAFGKVVSGMDVVDAIGMVRTGPGDKPIEDVTIIKAYMK